MSQKKVHYRTRDYLIWFYFPFIFLSISSGKTYISISVPQSSISHLEWTPPPPRHGHICGNFDKTQLLVAATVRLHFRFRPRQAYKIRQGYQAVLKSFKDLMVLPIFYVATHKHFTGYWNNTKIRMLFSVQHQATKQSPSCQETQ